MIVYKGIKPKGLNFEIVETNYMVTCPHTRIKVGAKEHSGYCVKTCAFISEQMIEDGKFMLCKDVIIGMLL